MSPTVSRPSPPPPPGARRWLPSCRVSRAGAAAAQRSGRGAAAILAVDGLDEGSFTVAPSSGVPVISYFFGLFSDVGVRDNNLGVSVFFHYRLSSSVLTRLLIYLPLTHLLAPDQNLVANDVVTIVSTGHWAILCRIRQFRLLSLTGDKCGRLGQDPSPIRPQFRQGKASRRGGPRKRI